MTEKIYIATDLGPGDGGKGSIVHWLANTMGAHTVIKRGGAQGSHGVRNSHGESFNFSQWGCGTLEGIPTFLSEQLVIMPVGLLNEANALRQTCGINNAFDLLQVDPNCVCATPYHKISSQIKELARGSQPRGTIGTGVGEAYRYANSHPELTIYASDLIGPVREKLDANRAQIVHDLAPVLDNEFLVEDLDALQDNLSLLEDDAFLDHVADLFCTAGKKIHFASLPEVLQRPGTAVVECSHGVLTDAERGLRPHTSAIRTLPKFSIEMLRTAGFAGQIVNLGLTRAYAIRHGAGPLPTADPGLNESLLPGSHKETNRWQGPVRVGPLDIESLRYAIGVCAEDQAIDGFCLTWFDQIVRNGEWKICTHYQQPIHNFTAEGLTHAVPVYQTFKLPRSCTREKLFDWCSEILTSRISIPVRLVSVGANELNKIFK